MKHYAIIPAAGSGLRFGGKKQYIKINGISLVERTIQVFKKTGLFEKIVVCLPEKDLSPAKNEIFYIPGGSSRAESVYKGFCFLQADPSDIILIHDAVRPLVSEALIERIHQGACQKGGVIPVLSVTDTIKEVEGDCVRQTVDRRRLVSVQTPQGFRAELLYKAYAKEKNNFNWTDEAMLVEGLGIPVHVIPGDERNIKVTSAVDLKIAGFLLTMDLKKDYI